MSSRSCATSNLTRALDCLRAWSPASALAWPSLPVSDISKVLTAHPEWASLAGLWAARIEYKTEIKPATNICLLEVLGERSSKRPRDQDVWKKEYLIAVTCVNKKMRSQWQAALWMEVDKLKHTPAANAWSQHPRATRDYLSAEHSRIWDKLSPSGLVVDRADVQCLKLDQEEMPGRPRGMSDVAL